MDFAEQIESVAYVLCGEGTINFDKFQHIWHAKGVSKLNIAITYILLLSFHCIGLPNTATINHWAFNKINLRLYIRV